MKTLGCLFAMAVCWVGICEAILAAGEEGAPLKIGQSVALTGNTAQLGLRVRAGVEAAIAEANINGGLNGRKLELISLDDGYEPARTATNMHRLIEQERVLAVVCNVGAPCAVTAVPIASAGKTLLYGYVTGGSVLRKTPPDRYVVNFRAGLDEEVDVLIGQFLARGIKPEEIAFFTQQDAYGDSAFAGGLAALQRAGLRLGHAPTHVRYPRNTMNIEAGLSELLLCPSNPKAVIIAGAGGPTVAIIREAKKAGFNPLFGTFSFVDAMYLAGELGSDAEGLIVTQVVPPLGSDVPMLRDYRSALKLVSGSEVESFASFESYLATRSLIEAIRAKPGDLSREAAVDALRGMTTLDLGIGPDRPVRMRKDGHTIAGYIWPTQIRSGRVELIDGASPTAAAEGGSR